MSDTDPLRSDAPSREGPGGGSPASPGHPEVSDLFRLMADNMPDMLWAKDMEKRFIFVNRAICEGLLGTSDTREPIGRTDLHFAGRQRASKPDDPAWHTFGEICSDSDSVVMESGLPGRFEESGNVRGEYLVLDVNKAPIFDSAGRMLGTVGSARPVTREKCLERERIAAQDALRESRTFLADAQRLAGMGSWTRDRVTGVRHWSDEMYKLTGIDRSKALDDETVDSTIHPDDLPGFRRIVREAEAAVRTIVDADFRILPPDGSVRFVHCRVRIEYDSAGNPLRHFGILHDVTSRHLLLEEKLELERRVLHAQKLESLGVLAGGIAHDFNNVLMGILGNADLVLADLPGDSPLRERLLEMVRAAGHAAELSRQMLAYAGMGSFVQRSLDPVELLAGMMELLQASVSKSTRLLFDRSEPLPRIVGDPAQIGQVVMNLVMNASESYGDSPGTVRIRLGAGLFDDGYVSGTVSASWRSTDSPPPAGEYAYIEVSDDGCGMPSDHLARIFDPFFSTKFAGRGLGLAVLLGIVRTHSGMISVDSAPGAGSTFRVLFPATLPEDAVARRETPREGGPQAGGTILVVDDEETVRSIVRSMLERAGYDVLCASDGQEAVDILRESPGEIRCVVLDLTMPRMTGEECFRRLRELRPDLRVLVSSGYDREDVTGRFRENELAGFIQKPYRYADLVTALLRAAEDPRLPE